MSTQLPGYCFGMWLEQINGFLPLTVCVCLSLVFVCFFFLACFVELCREASKLVHGLGGGRDDSLQTIGWEEG